MVLRCVRVFCVVALYSYVVDVLCVVEFLWRGRVVLM